MNNKCFLEILVSINRIDYHATPLFLIITYSLSV